MKNHYYNLTSGAKQGLLAFGLTVSSLVAHSQATYTLNYTGTVQTISLLAGSYDIEMWGADGGGTTGTNANAAVVKVGGKGGYAKGTLTLSAATTASVYVGGKGGTEGINVPGGFNGGGNSGAGAAASGVCGSGGGASDIRIGGNAFTDRKIVAGGGGAAGYQECNGTAGAISGGHGGGAVGGDPVVGAYAARIGHGATQSAGGAGGTDATYAAGNAGSFGLGANGGTATATSGVGAGGGGGWYGGGSGSHGFYCAGGGGGGSSYIGGVNSGTTIMFGQPGFVANPDPIGNGVVIIKELCSITLVASGANSVSPVICSGQSLTLTTNAISNYSWSTGATSSSLVVSPTSNTVYALTATSPSNCTAAKNITVTVSNAQPTLSVVSSTNQTCLGKTATLTASGAVNYTWTNGVSNGVSFYPSTTTTYTVTGDNGCGTQTAVATISVNPIAVTAVSSSSAICTNKTATLSVTAAATSYTFNPGNITGSSPNLIVNPQTNTNYTITVSDGTCSGVGTVSVVANPVPTISAVASSSIVCPGGTVGLSATGGINYTWTPVNLNGASITVSPQTSAVYNVTGDNNFGCLNNASQVVVVGAQPTLVLSSNSPSICGGGSATLMVSGADTYAWTGGPTTTVYVVNPTTNTTYTVTGTNSSSGCTDTKNIDIGVFTPTISVSGSSAVCDGSQVNLTASGGNSYTWNPGSLQFPSISVVPAASTIYTVDALAAQGILNCPGSTTFQVIVNPNPTVTTTSVKPAICAKETNTYSASGAITYTWTGGSAGPVVGPSITVTSSVTTIIAYTVSGSNAQGCVGENQVTATVFACNGIDQIAGSNHNVSVYPNPNSGDFTVKASSEMNVKVINALGQQVKELLLNADNNYRASVSDLSQGVYFVVSPNSSQKVIINK